MSYDDFQFTGNNRRVGYESREDRPQYVWKLQKGSFASIPLAYSHFPIHFLHTIYIHMIFICEQITVSKDDTVFLDGAGDKKSIGERCEQVGLHFSNYYHVMELIFCQLERM